MRKWLFRAFLILLALLFLAGGGLILFIRKTYTPDKVKAELETALTAKTGLAVAIGSLEFTWAGDIRLRHICIRNPAMRSPRCLVAADITSLDLRIMPLLKKRIEIRAAHLEDVELNFFTEAVAASPGKAAVLRSWDIPQAVTTGAGAAPGADLRLEALKISKGSIIHEVQALPLPLGTSRFALSLTEGDEKKISGELQLPDKGEIRIDLKARAANLLQSVRQLLKEGKAADADTVSGALECKHCNITALDRRMQSLTGKFTLEGGQNRINIATKDAELYLAAPIAGVFHHSGKVTLLLPALAIENGAGNLTAPGLNLNYSALVTSLAKGAECNFDATLDFQAARQTLAMPAGLKGIASVHGRFAKGVAAGGIRVRNFEYAAASGTKIESPELVAAFADTTLTLTNQVLLINQKWKIENVAARIRRAAGMLRADDVALTFARGRISGSYVQNLATQAQNLRFSATAVKAQDLSAVFSLKATVFGDVSADLTAAFQGFSPEEIRRTATGALSLRVGRGKVKDSFFQKGIFTGPLYKLEEKFSDTEFASLTAEFSFSKGTFAARKIFFDAEEWNVSLRAEGDAKGQGKAALEFKFRPSFVENVANPLLLGIEGRKEGEFYELPFACRGDVFSGSCYKQNW